MLLSTAMVPEHACPYTLALDARLSHDRFRARSGTKEVRAFSIGRAGWRNETFPGAFNSCIEQVYPCSSPMSRGLVLSLTYKEKLTNSQPSHAEQGKAGERCSGTQQPISHMRHARHSCDSMRKKSLSGAETVRAGDKESRQGSSNRSLRDCSDSVAEICFRLPLGRWHQCHRLSRKRTSPPPSLLQEAFEILSRGNHQGEAVD